MQADYFPEPHPPFPKLMYVQVKMQWSRACLLKLLVLCSYVQNYNGQDARTHAGRNLRTMSMAALYKEFGLDAQTVDFIG